LKFLCVRVERETSVHIRLVRVANRRGLWSNQERVGFDIFFSKNTFE
jgi:hypothetical protein